MKSFLAEAESDGSQDEADGKVKVKGGEAKPYVCATCGPKRCWCGGAHLYGPGGSGMFVTYRRLRNVVEKRLRDKGVDVTSKREEEGTLQTEKAREVVEAFLRELHTFATSDRFRVDQVGATADEKEAPGAAAASLDAA